MSNAVRHGEQSQPRRPSIQPTRLHVLLVEDDDGDALLVEEMLADAVESLEQVVLERVTTLQRALARPIAADCVLLDLQLPDATGLTGLTRLRQHAPSTAVIVLTGQEDEATGVAALGAGAQDYLVKQHVDGRLLARTLRYSWERSRAERIEQQLLQHQLLARENARLERGLLPTPLVTDPRLGLAVRYRPGRNGALLGGDFYDAVELPDGTLQLVIGDVCGHGPDEAALGVALRIAWRSVVLAGLPMAGTLAMVEEMLRHEALGPLFATVCMITVAPDRRSLKMALAGHPQPLLIDDSGGRLLSREKLGPPLGVAPGAGWQELTVPMGPRWSLLLYTDGLFEGRVEGSGERVGLERMAAAALHSLDAEGGSAAALDHLISEMDVLHGGPLDDDVALALLTFDSGEPSR
ncbi:PP2C family protein-serine/threonine phosphatase [Amycolatopsis sp. CB00013]|uniref:PP2C family protein-serine/threonine phosphatase n=1 Tax=Amycolatopsis sp. CB00013 TaxID=1703945 RepID=UPI00093F12B9|nr:fused response regulator/phosphatase [Amycolatopsis sp. CB00013]OKK01944.1 serine/threonine protein phosphatase [Amycolatopsis sp. CB00013]